MKKVLIILFFGPLYCFSQSSDFKEEVYIHLNATTLIAGETLLYSAFCNSETTGQPSLASKLLYVELVGEDGPVFQQKIMLDKGRGYGDFFISSTLKTGTYQLIAYTNWMRNFDDYFQSPVVIVNPFESYKSSEKSDKLTMKLFGSDTLQLAVGIPCKLPYRILGADRQLLRGKVVDQDGELHAFEIREDGLGVLSFTPRSEGALKAILEDTSGNFHFVQLPKVEKYGEYFSITEAAGFLRVDCQSTLPVRQNYLVNVWNRSELITQKRILAGEYFHLPKSDFDDKVLSFVFLSEEGDTAGVKNYLPKSKITLTTDTGITFGQRKLATLPLNLDSGSYSISIRKYREELDSYRIPTTDLAKYQVLRADPELIFYAGNILSQPNAGVFANSFNPKLTPDHVKYLPEYRGELISGKALDTTGNVIESKNAFISFVGENPQLQISTTDNNGYFTLLIDPVFQSNQAFLGLLDFQYPYEFELESKFLLNYPTFHYSAPKLDSVQIMALAERSINVQLENLYYSQKQDSILFPKPLITELSFDKSYVLDYYTRFENIDITFTELIPMVNYRKDRKPAFGFMMSKSNPLFDQKPLVLLDGLPVDGSLLRNYNLKNVSMISLVNNRQYIGSAIFDGVVSLETYNHDLSGFGIEEEVMKFEYLNVSPLKKYYRPKHQSDLSRIPDNREQLLWIPTFESCGQQELNFYTSSVTGIFQLSIEGFTSDGKPISINKVFHVD